MFLLPRLGIVCRMLEYEEEGYYGCYQGKDGGDGQAEVVECPSMPEWYLIGDCIEVVSAMRSTAESLSRT